MATAKEKRDQRDQELRDEGERIALAKLNQANLEGKMSAPAAGPVAPPSRGRTVIVACKLGVSAYQIQLERMVDKFEQNMQGGRTIRQAEKFGPVVILRGTSYPRGTVPDGYPPPPMIVAGAALNFGIDAEWFEQWMELHKQDPMVINKIIFAHERQDLVEGWAKELASVTSGLEPVNPKGDARITKSTRGEITNVAPEPRRGNSAAPSA